MTAQASSTSSLASSRSGRAASRASLSSSIAACRKRVDGWRGASRSPCRDVPRRPPGAGRARPGTPPRPRAARQPWRSADPAPATRPLPSPGRRTGCTGPGRRCRRSAPSKGRTAMATPAARSDRGFTGCLHLRTLGWRWRPGSGTRSPCPRRRCVPWSRARRPCPWPGHAGDALGVEEVAVGAAARLAGEHLEPQRTDGGSGLAVGLRVLGDLVRLVDGLGSEVNGGAMVVRGLLTRLAA